MDCVLVFIELVRLEKQQQLRSGSTFSRVVKQRDT